jgi:GNAT superfamily N-acetyltransferase
MMVTYAVEPWSQYKREACSIWPKHWEEIAVDRDAIKLNVDYAQYDALDSQGALHIVVARSAGRMVGYWLGIIRPHLHYKTSLSAFTDIYYVDPDFRKGRVGIELFKFAEKTLKARGVQKIFTGTKVHLDMSKVFEHLGYRKTEVLFTKVI